MIPIENVLLNALGQKGDRYIFGAEARASDPNPGAFDCSELVEWSCARSGVTPPCPDGAFNQWKATVGRGGRILTVGEGISIRGALLFVGDGTGSGRDAITHVAWSLGDGTTIEARGSKWGVGTWAAAHRFNFAGLLPGIDYTTTAGEDDMTPDQAAQLQGVFDATVETRDNVRKLVQSSDPRALAAELVKVLPAGVTSDAAAIEAALRSVFSDAGTP